MGVAVLPPKLEVASGEWLDLLVEAHVTDPDRWPEGARHGAALLARIQEIEAQCLARCGHWDAALLAIEDEDEYDDLCAQLDQLRRAADPAPNIPAGDVFAELDGR